MHIKLLLSGDGGQGVQTIADIICKVAFDAGFFVSFMPNYGLEQRGGVSLAFIQIGDKEIVYPKFTEADILLIMSKQAALRTERYLNNKNIKILNIEYCRDSLIDEKISVFSYNIYFLGALANMLADMKILKKEEIFVSLEKKLSSKPNWAENNKAFEIGTKTSILTKAI